MTNDTTTIMLNGEAINTPCKTVLELIETLALAGKRFAVEINQQLVPKSIFSETMIAENDQIEIIQAVGGG